MLSKVKEAQGMPRFTAAAMAKAGKTRDTYFDNLKAILIFLVVFGHFTHLNRSILLTGAVNNVIYSFHMPLFIFVSGYFSKNVTSQRITEIEKILYPYFIFQQLNYLFTKYTGLGYGSKELFVPVFQNWYLLGLFVWRLLIPYCNFYKLKYVLPATIFFSFAAGFFNGFDNFLGLYRIMYFFPIFIMGYFCNDLQKLLLRTSKLKPYLIGFSILSLLAIFYASFTSIKLNKLISLAYTPYSNYHGDLTLFYLRVFGFFSSIIISFGLLYFVPKRKFRLTYIGENTLNIFLLHMFLVFPISVYLVKIPATIALVISFISSILICLLISGRWLNRAFAPLTNLREIRQLIKH